MSDRFTLLHYVNLSTLSCFRPVKIYSLSFHSLAIIISMCRMFGIVCALYKANGQILSQTNKGFLNHLWLMNAVVK